MILNCEYIQVLLCAIDGVLLIPNPTPINIPTIHTNNINNNNTFDVFIYLTYYYNKC